MVNQGSQLRIFTARKQKPYYNNPVSGQGEAMFSTFYQYPGNKYVYGGIKTIKEFKEEGTQ